MTQYFDPHHSNRITIIGLGGTGAGVARILGRIAYDIQRSRGRGRAPEIVLIDPDRIEEKNVGRQLFAPSDIGQYKAEVASKRLNYALGLATKWIPAEVDANRHFSRHGSDIVVSCVDNYLARREINRISGILIASGNHNNAGQVTIGSCDDAEQVKNNLDRENVRDLPKEGLLFPSLLEPEIKVEPKPENLSCSELVATGEQDLLVNDWMATIVGQYIYKLLHRQPIHSFMTYINADGMTVRSVPINRAEVEVYL